MLCLFPSFCPRLMATRLYIWQPVSMVTPTRRRSCGCCWAKGPIPASATWKMTRRPTCCRATRRESRSADHSLLTPTCPPFKSSLSSTQCWMCLSFLAQAPAEETRCFLSSTYRALTGPRIIRTTCNPRLWGMSRYHVASVGRQILVWHHQSRRNSHWIEAVVLWCTKLRFRTCNECFIYFSVRRMRYLCVGDTF